MSQYYRVFCRNAVRPDPEALVEEVRRSYPEVTAHFRGDDLGWFEGRFLLAADIPPIVVERFLTKEDDIRGELNTWASWLESVGDTSVHHQLMQQVVTAAQLFTLRQPIEETDDYAPDPIVEATCLALCQFLAAQTDGIYQVDHHGLFAADGTLLVAE
jgi:hypothetical protein